MSSKESSSWSVLSFNAIVQRVRASLLAFDNGSEHGSLWGTYRALMRMPGSFLEDEVNRVVESRIELELARLPALMVSGLWFNTTQANDLLFEVQWSYEHGTELDSAIVAKAESDHRQHVVEHIQQLLARLAEQEALQGE